jgi:hypothetical protein
MRGTILSRRLPASKRCDGQGGLRSIVARVAVATGQLQKAERTLQVPRPPG